MASNRVIGINNTLPWHLPEDLKRFKTLTMGHPIIMGRKTYESLGRLLPGRTTVIVTRNAHYQVEGAVVVHSLQEAFSRFSMEPEVFLIGGAELYQQGLPLVDKLYITEIEAEFLGDTHFPAIDLDEWLEVESLPHTSVSSLSFTYKTYVRRSSNRDKS